MNPPLWFWHQAHTEFPAHSPKCIFQRPPAHFLLNSPSIWGQRCWHQLLLISSGSHRGTQPLAHLLSGDNPAPTCLSPNSLHCKEKLLWTTWVLCAAPNPTLPTNWSHWRDCGCFEAARNPHSPAAKINNISWSTKGIFGSVSQRN